MATRRKFKDKIPLEKEVELLEQYGRPWGDYTSAQEENFSKAIGKFFIAFSILENALDHAIISTISDRTDEGGYRIVKYLEFSDKINLTKDEYQRRVTFVERKSKQERLQESLSVIIRKLVEISEFRNKIAHANWESVDSRGFVRVKVKESKVEGMHFERIKITPATLGKFIRQAVALSNRLDIFIAEVGEWMFRS